jgi:methionine-rich copper-binding protein CopC
MQLRIARTSLIAAVAMVCAALLAVAALGRPPAAAVSNTVPADRATLGAAPPAVSVTFTTDVVEAHVAISGGGEEGAAALDRRTVTQPVRLSGVGHYTVAYHALTAGGDEVYGTLSFTVAGSGAGPDAPPPPPPALSGHGGHGVDPLTAVVLAANLFAVLVAVGLLLRRPRRSSLRGGGSVGVQ